MNGCACQFKRVRLAWAVAISLALFGCGSDATMEGPSGVKADAGVGADGGGGGGECAQDECDIDGVCVENGAPSPDNPCAVCRVLVNRDAWSADDTATCEDDDPCTDKHRCWDGKCVGTATQCDDDNPCTNDTCDKAATSGCASVPNQLPCSDDDLCTVGDTCKEGACTAGPARGCDDGNACTVNGCDKNTGCTSEPSAGACDDGDACSKDDVCKASSCVAGGVSSCDDGDVCTLDGCDPVKGCVHQGLEAKCEDNNPCTEDSCDPKKGCVYGFNTKPCDDNSLCSEADTCVGGVCKGAPVSVDDGNPCTDDSCEPSKGVVHAPNQLPCDDGDACTLNDQCAGSQCVAGATKLKCDDGNPCTDDSCNPKKGCVQIDNQVQCDDGDACTQKDGCANGVCGGAKVTCDDGNACTIDSCDTKKGCLFTLKETNACRPIITVSFPPRGATVKSDIDFVEVKGKVTSGAGPITSLTLNGGKLSVKADGTFKKVLQVTSGGNTLVFEATDSLGTKRKRVQAFLWSNNYRKPVAKTPMSGATDPGIAYFLSKQAIDDGKHDLPPNDLATIFELFLQNYDIAKVIPSPAYQGNGLTVTLENLKYGKAKVSLVPVKGAFQLSATVPNLTADLKAKWGWLSPTGTLNIKNIIIKADVVPTVVKHKLVVDLKNVTVTLDGFVVKLNGLASLLNGLIEGLKGTFVNSLQTSFAEAIKKELAPVLGSAFEALAFAFAFEVPALDGSNKTIKADVKTDFSKVSIDGSGAIFWLRAQGSAPKGNTVDNLGVPDRIGCGTGIQSVVVPKKDALELTLSDDTLNQVLYALWLGGLLEFPVPPALLGNVDLAKYGVSNLTMKAKALLAPTVSDCNPKKELLAHVGDMKIEASLELFGQKMDVDLWATFVAGVEVKVVTNQAGNSELGITLTDVKSLDLEVNVKQDNLVGSEKVIADLVGDNLVKGLLGALGGNALGSFELPKIDLSGTVQGLPPGTGIAIAPSKVVRDQGNTIVGGKLK